MIGSFLTNVRYSKRLSPKLNYIKENISRDILNVKKYYRERENRVGSNNLLYRLIYTMNIDWYENIDEFVIRLLRVSKTYTQHFNIVSSINSKEPDFVNLYNKRIKTIYYYKDSSLFDLEEAIIKLEENIKNIYNFTPLKFKYHNSFSFSYDTPFKTKDKEIKSIMELDLSLMILMYRYWKLDRDANGLDNDIGFFIYKVILPNTLESFMEYSIFNSIKYNKPLEYKTLYPISISDYSNEFMDIIEYFKEKNERREFYVNQLLGNIPTVKEDNFLNVANMSRDIMNYNNAWLFWSARLEMYEYLFDTLVNFKKGNGKIISDIALNTTLINWNKVDEIIDDGYNRSLILLEKMGVRK